MGKRMVFLLALVLGLVFINCRAELSDQKAKQQDSAWTVTGAKAERLSGEEAGFSPVLYPQIRIISSEEYEAIKKSDEIPETGLFLVDTDYVPTNIRDLLADDSLTLESDGTLIDALGQPVTLFMTIDTMKIVPDNAAQTKASPYPWYGAWATSRNDYHYASGVCRYFKAYIKAWARSKVDDEYLYTNIEYMYTYVNLDGSTDFDYCYNCSYETSSKNSRCDCIIPIAHSHDGSQYFYMRDGSVTASKIYYF